MKCEGSSWVRQSAGSGCLETDSDDMRSAHRQFDSAAAARSHQAGWLWPEAADLATFAVAFGFAAGFQPAEAGGSEGLTVSPGWAVR